MDPLVYKTNNVLARQRQYQADPRPVYQRVPGSKMYFNVFLGFFTVGMVGITIGTYNMAVGKKHE